MVRFWAKSQTQDPATPHPALYKKNVCLSEAVGSARLGSAPKPGGCPPLHCLASIRGSIKFSERKLVLVHFREKATLCLWAAAWIPTGQSGINSFWPGVSYPSSHMPKSPSPRQGPQKPSTTGPSRNQHLCPGTGCSNLSGPQFTSSPTGLQNPLPSSQMSPIHSDGVKFKHFPG